MSQPEASTVDAYITGLLGDRYDLDLYADIERNAREHGLPEINISASEGMLLHALARAVGARRILEIGTLGGYSGTWLASALPADGMLVTLEIDERHATAARENFARAGVADKVTVVLGHAKDSLDRLIAEGAQPFDITFIDADKDGYVDYLERALRLTRRGGLILADNTLSHGVLEGETETGIGRYNAASAAEKRMTSAVVATMRDGIDGLTISVVG